MKTLVELKKELHVGRKCRLLERFGCTVDEEREVVKVQSNSWCFKTEQKPASWLPIPKASLLEFDGTFIRIYAPGKRPPTEQEKSIIAGWVKLRDKEAEMTDGSGQFSREQQYYSQFKALYLAGYREERGMRFDHHSGLVCDEKVKGDLELVYKLI